MKINPDSIEYLIINHMEPDHSGWLEEFRKINDHFKVVCSDKAKRLLETFYGHTQDVTVVGNGDQLDLGNGHVISFTAIPNVHWPDTIVSFDEMTGVLFSCDAFGAFGSLGENKYGDLLSEEEQVLNEKETIRYYSNVLASFSMAVRQAVVKCQALPVKLVAPGHGYLWKNADKIMKDYLDYANYQKGPARAEITLIWGSMYGMTKKAVDFVVEMLKAEDILVHIHQVPYDSWGTVLMSAWTSTGIILAMPTYEYKMFPPMAATLEELGRKKVSHRKAFRFGSYGWSGGAQKELDEITERLAMNWEFMEPVEFAGRPKEEDLELIKSRVNQLILEVKAAVL